MTTPSTFNTPDRIIRMAMVDAGYLQDGDDPTPEQYANYLNRLNDLINFWQTQGLKLWLQTDLAVPLVAGQATYTIGPSGSVVMAKPTRVLDDGYYLDSSNIKRPLTLISRNEYMRLSNVIQTGAVNSYFVDKRQTDIAVSMWLVPDTQAASGEVHLLIQQQVSNLVSLTDSMNFPFEWFLALRWGLADDICTGQPQAIMTRCQMKAAIYFNALEAWDVEDASTRFTPDSRRTGGASTFQ
jgi:hypothetical protein